MALVKQELQRVFNYKKEKLQDPNPALSPVEVLDHYSDTYPELVNATMTGPDIKDDKASFEFVVKFKEKG
jgi:PRTRC genetic system protein C